VCFNHTCISTDTPVMQCISTVSRIFLYIPYDDVVQSKIMNVCVQTATHTVREHAPTAMVPPRVMPAHRTSSPLHENQTERALVSAAVVSCCFSKLDKKVQLSVCSVPPG